MSHKQYGCGTLLILAACTATSPTADLNVYTSPAATASYASVDPTDAELGVVAAIIRKKSAKIASIWPGYWSSREPFVLYNRAGAQLLVSEQAPGSPFLPKNDIPKLEGLTYWTTPREFDGSYSPRQLINGRKVYAMPARGATLFKRLEFNLHENFHSYQTDAWTKTADDEITGLSPIKFVKDPAILEQTAFVAGVEKEISLLREAIVATNTSTLLATMRDYLAHRRSRTGAFPDIQAIERRYERREGTATYVGCRGATLSLGGTASQMIDCVSHQFRYKPPSTPPPSTGIFANINPQQTHLLRWRLYSTGGAISLILDKIHKGDWKSKIASGASMEDLIAEAVNA